jgi:hypothetical protein
MPTRNCGRKVVMGVAGPGQEITLSTRPKGFPNCGLIDVD